MTSPVVSLVVTGVDAGGLARILPGLAALGPATQVVVADTSDPLALSEVTVAQVPDAALVPLAAPAGFCRLRNQAATAATAPWLLFLEEGMGLQRPLALRPRSGVCLASAGDHLGLLVAAEDFSRAGGYDETFQDPTAAQQDLLLRLAKAGVAVETLPAFGFARLVAAGPRPARSTEEGLYARVKADLVRLGSPPDAEARSALVMHIRATLAQANQGGKPAELYVQFRQTRAGASTLRASLTYTVQPTA